MIGLATITGVVVPRELFEQGHTMLREIGESGLESLVLWAGNRVDDVVYVRALLRPVQQCCRAEHGLYVLVEGPELHRINVWLYRKGLQLVAQIHTHPSEAYHSDTDDAIPIVTTVGGFSLVVPNFARDQANLETYAKFRLDQGGMWRELRPAQAAALIQIVD